MFRGTRNSFMNQEEIFQKIVDFDHSTCDDTTINVLSVVHWECALTSNGTAFLYLIPHTPISPLHRLNLHYFDLKLLVRHQ